MATWDFGQKKLVRPLDQHAGRADAEGENVIIEKSPEISPLYVPVFGEELATTPYKSKDGASLAVIKKVNEVVDRVNHIAQIVGELVDRENAR